MKVPFFHSVPTYQTEGAPWVPWFEKTAVLIILFFLWLMSRWFHFRRMPPSKCSSPRARVSLRSFPLSPTPVPEPWLTDFTQKEIQIPLKKTKNSSYSLPRGTDYIYNRPWRNSNLRTVSRTMEVVVKDSETSGFNENADLSAS